MADTHQILRCPACGSEMQKIFIPSEGVNIDICTQGCGGIFFDNREFEMFDEKAEDINDIIKAVENKKFKEVDTSVARYCPACGAKMIKNHTSVKQEVEIDECYACGGKFLDHGELTAIRKEYETDLDRTADTIRYVYDNVGVKLDELDNRKPAKRSLLGKLFDKLVFD